MYVDPNGHKTKPFIAVYKNDTSIINLESRIIFAPFSVSLAYLVRALNIKKELTPTQEDTEDKPILPPIIDMSGYKSTRYNYGELQTGTNRSYAWIFDGSDPYSAALQIDSTLRSICGGARLGINYDYRDDWVYDVLFHRVW